MKGSKIKIRGQNTYNKKVDRVRKWYDRLVENRKEEVINPNTKQPVKRKELKDLEFYINLIKKPNKS